MSKTRIAAIQKYLKKENLDGFIFSRHESMRYLCGFSGGTPMEPDGMLIITRKGADFLTDSRYWEQAKKELKGARLVPVKKEVIAALEEMKKYQGKNIRYGYEADHLTCYNQRRLQENLGGAILVVTDFLIDEYNVIKERSELELIKDAVEISDIAFGRILGYLKPGLREIDVAAELEYQMMMLGSEKAAFETIIASGYRSALPHGKASKKKIAKGDFVTFDFGATVGGYVSDITRTVVMGKATPRQKKVYGIVKRAQLAGIRKVKAGASGKAVDAAARNVIKKAGYSKYFGHGTGHGIGLMVHGKPSAGPRSKDILKRGMVLTVEPGIYIPGWGGVRIEDDVLVTSTGCRVLNSAPKNLLEL